MKRLIVNNRFDAHICELNENDVFELLRHETINGEHSLSITTTQVLDQGNRIIMQDDRGCWHEWVVVGVDALHQSGGRPVGTYYCVWSVQPDLMGTRISAMPGVQTPCNAATALDSALGGTSRWARGTVTNTATGGASMYDTDGWSGISTLIEVWGGEIDMTISVSNVSGSVTSRAVNLYTAQGDQTAKRRFDFGADLLSIRRILPDSPLYCRITPRGMGEQTESGAYGRKVTIKDVNGGLDYLENADMVPFAKLPDGNGGWEYPTLEIENSNCETPAELKAWAQSVLEAYTVPRITYEVDVLQLAREGIDMQGVSLGDAVQIVDAKFDGLRLSGRVVDMVTDELLGSSTKLTIGYIGGGLSDRFAKLQSSIDSVKANVDNLSESLSTADYIESLLDRINAEINATGGYTYIVSGHGILTYDVEVADPLNPVEASQVVEIKGGSIRIANTKTAQGEWEWRTVFVSGHVAAEMVTAAQLTTGYIGNANGTYWDLDNNLLHLPATTIMDDTTVEQVLADVDATITDVSVQFNQNQSNVNPPSQSDAGWSTTAPTWQAGYYIWQRVATTSGSGTTYSEPTCISGRDGATGTNAAAVYLYARSSSTPSKDMADPLTYTFATGAMSGSLGSWSRSIPSGNDTCWVTMATAISNSASDTIARSEWSDPVALTTAGVDGLNQATIMLFQRKKSWRFEVDQLIAPNASAMSVSGTTATIVGTVSGTTLTLNDKPAKPSSSTSYTFASGELSPVPSGWSRSVPQGTDTCWVTTAAAISASAVDSIAASEWADVARISDDSIPLTTHSIMYAAGDNGTTAPSTGWQSTVPTVAQGKWLWVRTTYSDGSTNDTCSYMGTDGEDGVSVAVQSATKTGGVTTVVLADTDGNTTTLTIADGEDGDTGAQGASGYVHIAWANSADGSVDFSTSVSTGKQYLGTYTDHTAADSQSYSDYSWSKIKGEQGADGDDGVGIASIVPQYYLSTSSTIRAGGSWSTDQPAWVSGKYIWERSKVTWNDGTVGYTEPVLAAAVNGANENASTAVTEAAKANAVIRAYNSGVLVCRQGNTVGALVNANGSFDVVKVTWSGSTPTASTVYASYGAVTTIGQSGKPQVVLNSSNVTVTNLNASGSVSSEGSSYKTRLTDGFLEFFNKSGSSWVTVGSLSAASGSGQNYLDLRTNNSRGSLLLGDNYFSVQTGGSGNNLHSIGLSPNTTGNGNLNIRADQTIINGTTAYTGSVYLTYGNGGKIYLQVKNGLITGWTV